ncbi:hypothetical protein [Dysgonomonas sp. ZJ279]|uniref:endonuclease/exonuclease/phosphatase family protein n=1 Tax=Dysgonomonas sp. ZJ279 TaxID=2709796 RepID=UPI0013EA2763|nr:hypothetical protein [Dysgonomonas sp. ZJ279]
MFYNVENLYDIKDNPKTNDDDLTPGGNLHWTSYRYWKKLNDISKVIISVGNGIAPALVGLCEVENDSVLHDLTQKANLKKEKYEYIITKSKDLRGSNVALLYQRDQIRILKKNTYTPVLDAKDRTTRDILHITGKVISGDTLDIFVCHFPSRTEGIKKTRPFRVNCAQLLKQKSDSLFRIRKKANIIIMGDFNDYPNDISMTETLRAQSIESTASSKELYNMFLHKIDDKSQGTYKYRGKWNYLDQFVVSGNLLNVDTKVRIKDRTATIYSADFLLENDVKYGNKKPFRTYVGYKYLGGTSDHLPIHMDLLINE